eukprot:3422220-Amphidinium_carterae.1
MASSCKPCFSSLWRGLTLILPTLWRLTHERYEKFAHDPLFNTTLPTVVKPSQTHTYQERRSNSNGACALRE